MPQRWPSSPEAHEVAAAQRLVAVEGVVLRDVADGRARSAGRAAADVDRAGGGPQESQQDPHQRRLAGAVGAEHGHELAAASDRSRDRPTASARRSGATARSRRETRRRWPCSPAEGRRERLRLAELPSLEGGVRGHRLADADDRRSRPAAPAGASASSSATRSGRCRAGRERGGRSAAPTSPRRRSGAARFHPRSPARTPSGVRLRETCGRQQVAGDRLGVRDGRAAGSGADRARPRRAAGRGWRRSGGARRGRRRREPGRPAPGAAAIAAATWARRGTSYQRCGLASAPWTPRASAIVTTIRASSRRRVLELGS